ncbi:hypothetical protein EV715DRAFT_250616, partial [Schizophyllum commune]
MFVVLANRRVYEHRRSTPRAGVVRNIARMVRAILRVVVTLRELAALARLALGTEPVHDAACFACRCTVELAVDLANLGRAARRTARRDAGRRHVHGMSLAFAFALVRGGLDSRSWLALAPVGSTADHDSKRTAALLLGFLPRRRREVLLLSLGLAIAILRKQTGDAEAALVSLRRDRARRRPTRLLLALELLLAVHACLCAVHLALRCAIAILLCSCSALAVLTSQFTISAFA